MTINYTKKFLILLFIHLTINLNSQIGNNRVFGVFVEAQKNSFNEIESNNPRVSHVQGYNHSLPFVLVHNKWEIKNQINIGVSINKNRTNGFVTRTQIYGGLNKLTISSKSKVEVDYTYEMYENSYMPIVLI